MQYGILDWILEWKVTLVDNWWIQIKSGIQLMIMSQCCISQNSCDWKYLRLSSVYKNTVYKQSGVYMKLDLVGTNLFLSTLLLSLPPLRMSMLPSFSHSKRKPMYFMKIAIVSPNFSTYRLNILSGGNMYPSPHISMY